MATKRKNDSTISKTINTISQKTKTVNEGAVRTSHQLLDGAFEKAAKWQDLFAQALETGVAYYGVQQDRLLTKLEGMKAQYDKGENPVAGLFNFKSTDLPAAPAEVLDTVKKSTKKVTNKVTTKAKAAKKTATKKATTAKKAVAKKATTTVKKAAATATTAKQTVAKKAATTAKAVKATADKVEKTAATVAKSTAKKATAKSEPKTLVVKPTATKDDLKAIKGIGPKMEQVLHAAGVKTFAQLAAATPKQLEAVLVSAGPRFKRFDTAAWTKEAKTLVK